MLAGVLREHAPAAFEEFVTRYGKVLDLAIEQSNYQVDNHLTEALQNLADEMGVHGVGPRDVLDVHNAALRQMRQGQRPRKAQSYLEEGRLLARELMGHLVSFYRRYAIGNRLRGAGTRRREEHDA